MPFPPPHTTMSFSTGPSSPPWVKRLSMQVAVEKAQIAEVLALRMTSELEERGETGFSNDCGDIWTALVAYAGTTGPGFDHFPGIDRPHAEACQEIIDVLWDCDWDARNRLACVVLAALAPEAVKVVGLDPGSDFFAIGESGSSIARGTFDPVLSLFLAGRTVRGALAEIAYLAGQKTAAVMVKLSERSKPLEEIGNAALDRLGEAVEEMSKW